MSVPIERDFMNKFAADYAIADAMLVAQYQTVKDLPYCIPVPSVYRQIDLELEEFLEKSSAGMCHVGSGLAIQYLIGKEHLFRRLLMVTANAEKKFSGGYTDFHSFFLALSQNNEWFAGSPGNHISNKKDSPIRAVIKSASIAEVVKQFEISSGGNWPSPEMIISASEIGYLSPRVLGNHLTLEVTRVFPIGSKRDVIDLSQSPFFY